MSKTEAEIDVEIAYFARALKDAATIKQKDARIAELEKVASKAGQIAPGVMHCAKCKFQLIRNTLNVHSGTVSAGTSETEPCPNGCGPLWPVTWEKYAKDWIEGAEQFIAQKDARIATLEARLAEIESAEAVCKQYQSEDGSWHNFINKRHEENAIADGRRPIRALYLHPPAQPATQVPNKKIVFIDAAKEEIEQARGWNACRAAMLAAMPKQEKN